MTKFDLEFLETMVRLGRTNRDLYRQLRAEAWAMVAENHARMSDAERDCWKKNAS